MNLALDIFSLDRDMSSPLKRIKEYIDFKRIRISAFEKSVGFSNGLFGGQLKRNKTIGLDKLESILKTYPDLNADWVLTGKGNMLKKGGNENIPVTNQNEILYSLNTLMATQQRIVSLLEQLVGEQAPR